MTRRMLTGIDEAGYGPMLGPLVIASSTIEGPEDIGDDLWTPLAPLVHKGKRGGRGSIRVADSKAVKTGKSGVEALEIGVLAFLAAGPGCPETVGGLLDACAIPRTAVGGLPWYDALLETALPAHGWRSDIEERGRRLKETLEAANMAFLGFRAGLLSARDFNDAVAHTDNKATAHLGVFGPLVQAAVARADAADGEDPRAVVHLESDKLGGRDRYGPVLGRLYPGRPIDILEQGGKCSRYRVNAAAGPFTVRFRSKADGKSFVVALSSMLAKYLRELAMGALNAWFLERKPGLKPTAGYVQDARRFLEDLGETMEDLPVPRDWLIRSR